MDQSGVLSRPISHQLSVAYRDWREEREAQGLSGAALWRPGALCAGYGSECRAEMFYCTKHSDGLEGRGERHGFLNGTPLNFQRSIKAQPLDDRSLMFRPAGRSRAVKVSSLAPLISTGGSGRDWGGGERGMWKRIRRHQRMCGMSTDWDGRDGRQQGVACDDKHASRLNL